MLNSHLYLKRWFLNKYFNSIIRKIETMLGVATGGDLIQGIVSQPWEASLEEQNGREVETT